MSAQEVAIGPPDELPAWGGDPDGHPAPPTPQTGAGSGERWPEPPIVEVCHAALASMQGSRLTEIGVTSCVRAEGRSTVALAVASVEHQRYGRRTLLVELDLERPSLGEALGLGEAPGVADVLRGEVELRSAIRTSARGVHVLTAGRTGGDPGALMGTLDVSRVAAILDSLCLDYDCVVADLPPLSSTAGIDLARACATPLLVVRAGLLPAADIKRSMRAFGAAPPVILNRVGGTSRRRGARRS